MLECRPAMVSLSKAFLVRLCVVLGTAVTFFIITLCIYIQRPIECLRSNSTRTGRFFHCVKGQPSLAYGIFAGLFGSYNET